MKTFVLAMLSVIALGHFTKASEKEQINEVFVCKYDTITMQSYDCKRGK